MECELHRTFSTTRLDTPSPAHVGGKFGSSLLATTALVAVTALLPGMTRAQDATWLPTPGSANFNDGANWNTATVPTRTATFDASSITALSFSAITAVGGLTFNTGTPAYSFNNTRALTFVGAGIIGGSATITNNGALTFNSNSTAGTATIINNVGKTWRFIDNSTAGTATITNFGNLRFFQASTAGSAIITNNSDLNFNNTSTAGTATFTNNAALGFFNRSTAGMATVINTNSGTLFFQNNSTADRATITNNHSLIFTEDSGAGSAGITNNDFLFLGDRTTAGSATITNNNFVEFDGNSTGGNAAITNATAARVDFSASRGPEGDRKLSVGSIAGAGSFILGRNELTVGGNNLSTEVSGAISGFGGSLVKVGTGTLTLSGTNTYTGATNVNAGTFNVTGSIGSAELPSGPIGVLAGATLNVGAMGAINIDAIPTGNLTNAGTVTVEGGGKLTDFGGFIGNLPGSQGTVTVSGAGSIWTNTGTIVVGGQGAGTLTIQDGGTVNSGGGGSVGLSAGSTGIVTVTGSGSNWTNRTGGGLNIGSLGTGALLITNGGMVINDTAFTANVGNASGSQGTVAVTGAGSTWSNSSGVNIGNLGTGTLTIAEGGVVNGPVVIAADTRGIGTLNVGAGAGSPAAAPGTLNAQRVIFGAGTGTINFNHTSPDYVFAPVISGVGTINVLAGTTRFAGANDYGGPTNVIAGTLRAGAVNTFSPNSPVRVASGGTIDLNGFSHTVPGVTNAGVVNMGTGTAPGTTLTTTSYIGAGGTIALNTVLGTDGSPSDKLVIDGSSATGGSARGSTSVRIANADVTGAGAETLADGIQVVQTTSRATTTAGAFTLAGRLRAGFYDYRLFRGSLDPNNNQSPNDWFLRSSFFVGLTPIGPSTPVEPSVPIGPSLPEEKPSLPIDRPSEVLPPGLYPIIGPEIATYGVVQPMARQLGMTTLGTLHDRVGDTTLGATATTTAAPCPADGGTPDKPPAKTRTDCANAGSGNSAWGRLLGEQIDNHYRAFADPRTSGHILGFQSGLDLWRGEGTPGHHDSAGIYVGYANANVDVSGLVTNDAATNYLLRTTGSLNLDAWSGAAYWTHYGPGGWYVDAVAQATLYGGNANTQFTRLETSGFGFLSSLESGYPFQLPAFGPNFVLEPQAQLVWQHVSFDDASDGLGVVALGTTSGTSGRIGLRGKWTIVDGAKVWQPYFRINLWRDWGAEATAVYSGIDSVPLQEQATRLQLGGGVSVNMNANLSVYANADYQRAVGNTDRTKRDGVRGAAGVRYTW